MSSKIPYSSWSIFFYPLAQQNQSISEKHLTSSPQGPQEMDSDSLSKSYFDPGTWKIFELSPIQALVLYIASGKNSKKSLEARFEKHEIWSLFFGSANKSFGIFKYNSYIQECRLSFISRDVAKCHQNNRVWSGPLII